MIRVMRSNYDKPWRCPGWSGPALTLKSIGCPGGSFAASHWSGYNHAKWKLLRCEKCGTWVLPNVAKWLDPSWIKNRIRSKWRDYQIEREWQLKYGRHY